MNREELIARFSDHPPDTPERKAAHDAVNQLFAKLMGVTMSPAHVLSLKPHEASKLILEAVLELDNLIPDSDDKSVVFLHMQLARNFLNLGLKENSFFYVRRANEDLLRARFLANTAVAMSMATLKPARAPVSRAYAKKKS